MAYAELRDRAYDLNIGNPRSSPLEFLAAVADDDEHAELAWLVTRGVWGDLARDLREDDLTAAEEMARSVSRRMAREQTGLNRVLGAISRASLRDAWTDEIPNLWWAHRPRRRLSLATLLRSPLSLVRGLRGLARAALRTRRVATTTPLVLVIVAGLVLGSCGGGDASALTPAAYPEPLVPDAVAEYRVVREESVEGQFQRPGDSALVSEGRVFSIRGENNIEGSFQVSLFKPDIDNQDPDVQRGVERGLGAARGFQTIRFGLIRLRTLELTEQRLYLWFPPERNVMELFLMRKNFDDAERVAMEIVAHQRGMNL